MEVLVNGAVVYRDVVRTPPSPNEPVRVLAGGGDVEVRSLSLKRLP